MIRTIFFPNKFNGIIWANALFLLFFLVSGKVSALVILFAYFLETIIIGLFNFLKMMIVSLRSNRQRREGDGSKSGIFKSLFFCVHYGGFVAVQSIFAFAFFQFGKTGLFNDPFDLLYNYMVILRMENIQWVLVSIISANLAYFYTNFLSDQQYHDYKTDDLFMLPYVRIFIQQFVVILAGFFIVLLKAGMAAAILLILMRLVVDLTIVSIRKNGGLVDRLARKLSNDEKEYQQAKEALETWSE